ncbi:alpha/beta hydrolase [Burkholderia cepacia]|uniref:alpha/beta hydrolase n=1 Tax=Burkholderia cepacia TaxID=292 RepID=UPI002019332E|nr:alpha/beta hydrolase [Burkholderia cepacia]UQO39410.1 alpha/beta hydrolase [Burkholderia cepacia]UQO49741.1 alpha/beta hydrolase [Burkholderia cepacia]UQP09492.1 alpha/beta hydrolase [Burkholderia cepacia]
MSLDTETRAFMEKLAATASKPRHLMTPDEARAAFARISTILSAGADVRATIALDIPVDGGTLRARLFVPHERPQALLVYFHGGGWVVGGIEEFTPLCREIAVGAGVAVSLVEYRKAPEHPFPRPVLDAWQAAQWLVAEQRALLGTTLPVLVGGDSAGANLAIAVTLLARRERAVSFAGQLLVYPVTDCVFDRPSYVSPDNQLLTNRDAMMWYWTHYAPTDDARQSSLASPLREADLSGLPEAIVVTAEHDVLRDEGEAYARRLEEAGVPVQHLRAAEQMHGFLMMVGILPGSRTGLEFICDRLRRVVARASH